MTLIEPHRPKAPFSDLKVGHMLPNGAIVMAYCVIGSSGIVLASRGTLETMNYVTWTIYNNDLRSTAMGHYFTKCSVALDDFSKRVTSVTYDKLIGAPKI